MVTREQCSKHGSKVERALLPEIRWRWHENCTPTELILIIIYWSIAHMVKPTFHLHIKPNNQKDTQDLERCGGVPHWVPRGEVKCLFKGSTAGNGITPVASSLPTRLFSRDPGFELTMLLLASLPNNNSLNTGPSDVMKLRLPMNSYDMGKQLC